MLILKQNAANTVPTPPAGKGTIFLDDSDTLSVKTSDGNVETFPTVAASNAQVVFMNGTSLSGEAALTYDFNNNVLNVSGNVAAGNVKTDNLLYANGTAWDLSDPGGSNTQIQFNDDESFGGSAAFTFDKSSNLVTVSANLNANNLNATTHITSGNVWANSGIISAQTLKGEGGNISNIQGANVSGTVATATNAGTVTTAAQPNITSVGNLTALVMAGNLTPATDDTYDLGNTTHRFKDIWLSGNSIRLGGAVISANATAVTITNPQGGNTFFTGSTTSNNSSIVNGTSNVVAAASGNVTTSVNGTANVFVVTATGANITGTLNATGNANLNNLGTAQVLASANVTAPQFVSNVSTGTAPFVVASQTKVTNLNADLLDGMSTNTLNTGLTIVNRDADGSFAANIITANLSGAATTAGTVTTNAQPNITSVGTLTSLSVTGNASAGNLNTAGKVVASTLESNVATGTAPFVVASTTRVANLDVAKSGVANTVNDAAQPNITSVGTLTSLAVTGNATAGNVYANAGTIGASLLTGTLTTASQPNITSVGTLSSLTTTGNVAAGNLTTTGVLSVTGTGVSSIGGNLDMTSNTIINLANPTNDQDAATKYYVDSVAQGLHVHDSCYVATTGTLDSASGGTVSYNNGSSGVGATLTTTGTYLLIDGGNVQTVGTRILVKNEANAAWNGVYTYTSTTVLTRATDYDTTAEAAGGDFLFVTSGTVNADTGWVQTTDNPTIGTSNIVFTQFAGAGTYTAGTGLTLTGTVFSVNASQTQVTSVGTLGTLNVSGNANVGNIGAAAGVFTTVSGNGALLTDLNASNVSSGTLAQARLANASVTLGSTALTLGSTVTTVAGLTSVTSTTFVGALTGAATTAGTVTTASQPNITSVGTLTSLSVTGNANVGNIGAAAGVFTSVSGNGALLTDLNASNISSGTLAQARLANSSLTINGSSVSLGGTVTVTATATNALTLGSYLTGTSYNGSTAVTAAVDATSANTASKVVARDASGNFSAGTITATLSGAATTAGTVTTAAQPNITSVGTLTGLTVSATISGSVSGSAATVTTAAQPNITSVGTLTGLTVSGATTISSNSALTTTNLTTGANSTAGYITGNWTLTTGSKLQATYADLAEKYTADANYGPGTVLLFGGDHEVTISNVTDSHCVAGVVSTNPAYVMNSGCQGEHVVDLALQGRVPVKVHGPVAKGDLMVSGPNGHAVANNMARAGTIIGKALQNFSGDHGVIEVVIGRV